MKIHNIGFNHRNDENFRIDRPGGSGDCLLLLLKTPAVFTLNGEDMKTEAGSFILFTEGTPQLYRAAGEAYTNDWCHFEMNGADREFIRSISIPLNTVVKVHGIEEPSAVMNSLCREFFSGSSRREEICGHYMNILFIKLSEKMTGGETDPVPYYGLLSELRAEIYNMPYEEWNADMLAKRLSVSKSYFQHIYSRAFGISAANDIIRSRTEYSKYLLSSTDLPVSRIAEMSGYKCQAHFIRQFKSRTGVTPSGFRLK